MIFGHIVGLTQHQKEDIYKKYNNSKYIFKDLDDITDLIMEDKNMFHLIQKYEYYINKAKDPGSTKVQSRQLLTKSREMNNKINTYWKKRLEFYINEIKEENNEEQMTILLGYSNFYRNIRTFVNVNATIKIFVHADMNEYTKDIIQTNLDTYRSDIIEGNFNLELINPTFLIKRRQAVENIYSKKQYDSKTYEESLNFLGNSLENYDIPSVLFYASRYEYKKHIPIKDLVAYTDEWISIVSSYKDKNIIKGYMNDDCTKPYVQELHKGSLNKMKNKLYVYIITNTALFMPVFTKNFIYKYKSSQNAQISKVVEVENAYERLKQLGIAIIDK